MAKGGLVVPRTPISQPVVSDTRISQKRRALDAAADPQLINNELDYLHERVNLIVVEAAALTDLASGATLGEVITRVNELTEILRQMGGLKRS